MKYLISLLFILLFYITSAQTVYFKIVDAKVVMKSGGNIIINGTNTDAITSNAGGHLISEEQINKVRWIIKTSTGNYVVPFKDASGNSVAIAFNLTVAGTGNGYILYSVGPTISTPDNQYMVSTGIYPTPIGNITNTSNSNNALNMANRFWFVDYSSYTTNPTGTYTLYYTDNDISGLTEANLQAQYWNTSLNKWVLPPTGTVNVGTNNVSGINSSSNGYVWAILDKNFPLPIKLEEFKADCQSTNGVINFIWATLSEIDTDFFVLEKSFDGTYWSVVKKLPAAGNSNTRLGYSVTVATPYEPYFRLKTVDYDGTYSISNVITTNCDNILYNAIDIYPNPTSSLINIAVIDSISEYITIDIYNSMGDFLYTKKDIPLRNTIVDMSSYGAGIYFIRIYNNHGLFVYRVIKT